MNNSFKKYFNKSQQPDPVKWSVLLFTGDYDPICREEYHRIDDYIKNYVRSNPGKFEETADIGLLTSSSSLNNINTQMKYELTFEERQFVAGKLFGFKMFPIDFNELFTLAHFDKDDALKNKVSSVAKFFREQFDNANILIVLRPSEGNLGDELKEVAHVFSDNGLNIGFMTYEHAPITKDEYFKKIPVTGKMIKACCVMDSERPDALNLKNFAYKYNLQQDLDAIKLMHFKSKNEKYDLVFRYLFPDVKLHERTNEEQECNTRTIMEIIKRMYISKA